MPWMPNLLFHNNFSQYCWNSGHFFQAPPILGWGTEGRFLNTLEQKTEQPLYAHGRTEKGIVLHQV